MPPEPSCGLDIDNGKSDQFESPMDSGDGQISTEIDETEDEVGDEATDEATDEAGNEVGDEAGDDFVAVDETTASDNPFAQRIRQRAEEEHHEQLRLCPHFNYTYQDTDGLQAELDEWFEYVDNGLVGKVKDKFKCEYPTGFRKKPLDERKSIINSLKNRIRIKISKDHQQNCDEQVCDLLSYLSYVAMGTYGEVTSLEDHLEQIKGHCTLLWECGVFSVLYDHMRLCLDFIVENSGIMEEVDTKLKQVKWSMTTMYFMLESGRGDLNDKQFLDKDFLELNPPILSYFTQLIAKLRWTVTEDFPIRNVLLLFWKCILLWFGDRTKLDSVKRFIKVKYNLPTTKDSDDIITASPLDYHEFRDDIMSRYPTYDAPGSTLNIDAVNSIGLAKFIEVSRPSHTQAINSSIPPPSIHIATPAPSPQLAPIIGTGQKLRKSVFMTNQSFPFLFPTDSISENGKSNNNNINNNDNDNDTNIVPRSIVEAGELFSSRVRTTPAMLQLWDERDKFMQHERGWFEPNGPTYPWSSDSDICPESIVLERVEDYYISSLPYLSSFIHVLLRELLENVNFNPNQGQGSSFEEGVDVNRNKEINLKSISAILELLSSWFKVSHIIKSEYFSTLLFDGSYFLIIYKFLYLHIPLERALDNPDISHLNFFSNCRIKSECLSYKYGDLITPNVLPSPEMAKYSTEINSFSSRYFFTMINFIRVLRRIIKGKTQRIIVIAGLPSDTLKKLLSIHQDDLYRMVLEIFKEQAPYNGRKWKYSNMDLVSAIYLHCKAKLRDDWLSGLDISGEVDDAYPEELAMRSLTLFYNSRLEASRNEFGLEDTDVDGLNLQDLSVGSGQNGLKSK